MTQNICVTCCCSYLIEEIGRWSFWSFVWGYGSFFFFSCFTREIMRELKSKIKLHNFAPAEGEAYLWYARIVGYLDGILYISALYFNLYLFIPAWLAFKIAGRWQAPPWEAKEKEASIKDFSLPLKLIINNGDYNIFTIGNGLSIIYAGLSWQIILWFQKGLVCNVFLSFIFVCSLSYILLFCAKKQTRRLESFFPNNSKKN